MIESWVLSKEPAKPPPAKPPPAKPPGGHARKLYVRVQGFRQVVRLLNKELGKHLLPQRQDDQRAKLSVLARNFVARYLRDDPNLRATFRHEATTLNDLLNLLK